MKASKDGQFSLEVPDGTDIGLFGRMLDGLIRDRGVTEPTESNEYDTYLPVQDLDALFHLGPLPSRKAAFQEIRNRAKRMFNEIATLRRLFNAKTTFTEDFDGDLSVLQQAVRAEEQNKEEHQWVFKLIHDLVDLLGINIDNAMKNVDIATTAVERIGALRGRIGLLRAELQVQGKAWPQGFNGDLLVLDYLLAHQSLQR